MQLANLDRSQAKGRLDWLLYKIAERAAGRVLSAQEWQQIAPAVDSAISRNLGSLAGRSWADAVLCPFTRVDSRTSDGYTDTWCGDVARWISSVPGKAATAATDLYKGTVQPPKPGPAPAAPQTREEMLNWTPSALAQRNAQRWIDWAKMPFPEPAPGNEWKTWAILAAVALAAYFALRVTTKGIRTIL